MYHDRSASLDHVTKLLREQLDHETTANQSLTAEVAKLNAMREEFEVREAEFKRQEQVGYSCYSECEIRYVNSC